MGGPVRFHGHDAMLNFDGVVRPSTDDRMLLVGAVSTPTAANRPGARQLLENADVYGLMLDAATGS